jgi:hypothetical protein
MKKKPEPKSNATDLVHPPVRPAPKKGVQGVVK